MDLALFFGNNQLDVRLLSRFSHVWLRHHRWQPTRLPCPWDSPGKNTGVGCHFLLQCVKVKSESEVAQSCPTLSDPMDCSLPGSSIHGIFQARVLEWGAIAFSTIGHRCKNFFVASQFYSVGMYDSLLLASVLTSSDIPIMSYMIFEFGVMHGTTLYFFQLAADDLIDKSRWPDWQKSDVLIHLNFSGHVGKAVEGVGENNLSPRYTLSRADFLVLGKKWVSK